MLLLFTQTLTMGSYYTTDENNKVNGIMTVPNIYQFKGFIFEFHSYLGPVKVKKNFDPASAMGRKFWKMYSEWDKLTPEEKLKTQIFG
jgi:hypothetical protein